MNPIGRKCDNCGWRGEVPELAFCPSEDRYVCPRCWAEGFVSSVREPLGPLVEAFAPPDVEPRYPKAIVDWTEEEWAAHEKMSRAREAHERSDVKLPCNIDGWAQLGFGFMRDEFRVSRR